MFAQGARRERVLQNLSRGGQGVRGGRRSVGSEVTSPFLES